MTEPNVSTSVDETKQPTMDEPKGKPEGGVEVKVEGAEKKEGQGAEAPKPRTYSEEEWNKRQSAVDKQVAKVKVDSGETLKGLQETIASLERKTEEAEYAALLKSTEDSGGDADKTRLLIEEKRTFKAKERLFEAEKKAFKEQAELLSVAGKGKKAFELIKQYELSADDEGKLLEAESEDGMENIALKLQVEKLKTGQRPSTSVDSGLSSGKPRDLSKMPESESLGTMMEESLNK